MPEASSTATDGTTHVVSVPLTVHLTVTGPPSTLQGVMLRDTGTVEVSQLLAETVRYAVEQHLGEMEVVVEGTDLTRGVPFRATGALLAVDGEPD